MTKVLRLVSKENIFYGHPESSGYKNIKLQKCVVIPVNFFLCAARALLFKWRLELGALAYIAEKIGECSRSEPKSTILEYEFYVRES